MDHSGLLTIIVVVGVVLLLVFISSRVSDDLSKRLNRLKIGDSVFKCFGNDGKLFMFKASCEEYLIKDIKDKTFLLENKLSKGLIEVDYLKLLSGFKDKDFQSF